MGERLMKVGCLNPLLRAVVVLTLVVISGTSMAAKSGGNSVSLMADQGNIASIWVFQVKDGHEAAFDKALKQHMAWRKSAGEKFVWTTFQPIVGDELDHYVFRSGPHHWADFDTNHAWQAKNGTDQAFADNIAPHLSSVKHFFAETDIEHSHWIETPEYEYFGIATFHPVAGTSVERRAVMDKIQGAIAKESWNHSYQITNSIGGPPTMSIVTPMRSYAEMAGPSPSLANIVAKSLGSEAAAAETLRQFSSSVSGYRYTVYIYRPDLSTPK
jgi:hypothetical protein